MHLHHLILTILFLATALAKPTPQLTVTIPNPFAPASPSTAPAPASQPATTSCTCTVVFGNKAATTLVKVPTGSTIGITGQDKLKKACSANLLTGSGCAAAVAGESSKNCVTSASCAVA